MIVPMLGVIAWATVAPKNNSDASVSAENGSFAFVSEENNSVAFVSHSLEKQRQIL